MNSNRVRHESRGDHSTAMKTLTVRPAFGLACTTNPGPAPPHPVVSGHITSKVNEEATQIRIQ